MQSHSARAILPTRRRGPQTGTRGQKRAFWRWSMSEVHGLRAFTHPTALLVLATARNLLPLLHPSRAGWTQEGSVPLFLCLEPYAIGNNLKSSVGRQRNGGTIRSDA